MIKRSKEGQKKLSKQSYLISIPILGIGFKPALAPIILASLRSLFKASSEGVTSVTRNKTSS